MEDLQQSIYELIKKTIPDINEGKAAELAVHLTSEAVGVRSLERLYDVPQNVISTCVPVCDAVSLHRAWQSKFCPERLPLRQLQNQPLTTYRVKWNQIPKSITDQLQDGVWLAKADRCLLVQLVVKDVLTEFPDFKRPMFKDVAASMVAKYPHALHDRNKDLLKCSYLEQKLKFRFDEVMRAMSAKKSNEAPNIPEAHGCVRWRVKITPAEREEMVLKKERMNEIFSSTLRKHWPLDEIEKHLSETYPLQREDINGQVKKKARRARGSAGQGNRRSDQDQENQEQEVDEPTQQLPVENQEQEEEQPKTTQQLTLEWPFLFQSAGLVLHFNELTKTDWLARLAEFKETFEPNSFIKFLSTLRELKDSSTRKQFKRAVKRESCQDPDLLAIVLMLTEYYKEDEKEILIEIESTTKMHEVGDIDGLELPPTPCLLSLGPAFKAKKYFFTVDGSVVSSMKTFQEGFSALFCSYFVLNIKYAPKAGHTLDFFQRVVAKIEPNRGSKMTKRNYKQPISERMQSLLDKHATWQRQQQTLEDEDDMEIV